MATEYHGIKSCTLALFPLRLVLRVQQQVEAEEGDTQRDQWREFVGDLWDNRLPHLRSEVYGDGAFVFDPHTGRYGFQEGSEFDSEGELMDDLMNEPEEDYTQRTEDEESFLLLSEEQQPSLESSREEETKRAEHPWEHQEEDECEYFVLLRRRCTEYCVESPHSHSLTCATHTHTHTHTHTQCRVCYGRTQSSRRKYSPWPGHSIKVGDTEG